MRVTFALLLLLMTAGPASGLDRRTRELMHTEVTIALPNAVPLEAREAAFTEAFAVFEGIESELNEWKPDSALARINSGAGKPVEAPRNVCEVISLALDGARRTGGLFDPTWAALRGVWKFGSPEEGVVPATETVAALCSKVKWEQVKLTTRPDGSCTVQLGLPGMQLGLGGLVKGWGVDRVVSAFRKEFLTKAAFILGPKEGQKLVR